MKFESVIAGIAVLGLTATAQEWKVVQDQKQAQYQKQSAEERVMVYSGANVGLAGPGQSVRFMSYDAGPVKGAPYAAEATNETIQTLADGNRIVEKNSSKMYRDAEGRTRMENNFGTLGPLVPEGKAPSITSINDPVSGENFILDNNRKSATKMIMPRFAKAGKPGEQREIQVEMQYAGSEIATVTATGTGTVTATASTTALAPATIEHDVMIAGPAVMATQARPMHLMLDRPGLDVKKESLGKQTIEGVECDGTRETMTIPAGQIGNERPLVSVTERWYSTKLGLDVSRKHTDPRFGETNYRLTRIEQADQPRSLFEVPADYKVEEGGGNVMFNKKFKEAKE